MHIDHIIPKANFKTTIQNKTNIPDNKDIIEAQKREKMIEEFNAKNNKTHRKKKNKKKRPRGRRRK